MDEEREIPGGRVGRLARMAVAGARAGASVVASRDGEAAARAAAETLGTLRGVAAKVGQMAGYVDGVIPEEHREAYENWMGRLMAAAPKSSASAIRALVEEELGAPIDELYAEWDDASIASASIGQVHQARLHDGRSVVVKVQHPGVAEAVESDLKNAGVIEKTMALGGGRKFGTAQSLKEIRDRFREELDYTLEAERQRTFRRFHAADPAVVVPEVIDDRSTERVLTSERVSGLTLAEARDAPLSDRAAWIATLWRYNFKGILVGGMFNADPHPGNFFFAEGGKVCFLDFGCVQQVPMDHRIHASRMHRRAAVGDVEGFHDGVRGLLRLRGGAYEPRALAFVTACFAPLLESPYKIEREYVAGLVQRMKRLAIDTRNAKRDKFVPMPEGMFFMNRLQFGFYSVVARLDAEVDFVEVERAFLADAPE